MLRHAWLPLLTALAAAIATPGRAATTVDFVHPEGFTDASLYGEQPVTAASPALLGIRREFERLGQRLPPGQTLRIEILDVDLAGLRTPWQPAAVPVRRLTPATWPRIRLRYVLEQDGRPLRSGEEDVVDRLYLQRAGAAQSLDPLHAEDAMLRDWFETRFGPTRRR